MKLSKTDTIIHCSFCGRSRNEVKILIAGQQGHICENCTEHAHEIIEKEFHQKKADGKAGTLTVQKPTAIKAFLDQYIIGQDEAKKFYVWQFIIISNASIFPQPQKMKLRLKKAM